LHDRFACANPAYRIARRLLSLSKRFGRRKGEVVWVVQDLIVNEISLFAGGPADAVAGALRDFTDRGLILFEDGALVIVDGQGLA
jgi:CRP/FNR family transcriptional regulator, cyclic AMP receptor protein